MSSSFGVLSNALPKLRSMADRFGLGTSASGDGVTCAWEGAFAAAAAATAATALGRPLLGCLNPGVSVVVAAAAALDWKGDLAEGDLGAEEEDEESGNSSLTCTLEVDEEECEEETEEDPEEIEETAAAGAVRAVGEAPSPLLAFIVMSLGLFWELVGVSHELESERSPALLLDTCFMSLKSLRRLARRPSHGERSPSSETSGRSRGGSCGSGGGGGVLSSAPSAIAAPPLPFTRGKSAPVADGGKESKFGVVSMSPSPLPLPPGPSPPDAARLAAAKCLSMWPLDSPDADGVNRGVGKLLGESCNIGFVHTFMV